MWEETEMGSDERVALIHRTGRQEWDRERGTKGPSNNGKGL